MPKKSLLFTLVLTLSAIPYIASGQGINKCQLPDGRMVYREEPCQNNKNANTTPSAETSSSNGGPVEYGKALCRDGAVKGIQWADPESLRVRDVMVGKMQVINYQGVSAGARQFFVKIHPKNQIGALTVTCYTSEDGRRILKMEGGNQ